MGTVPSADGVTEYTDAPGVVGTDATHWLAFGSSGSNSSPEFSGTAYARGDDRSGPVSPRP